MSLWLRSDRVLLVTVAEPAGEWIGAAGALFVQSHENATFRAVGWESSPVTGSVAGQGTLGVPVTRKWCVCV